MFYPGHWPFILVFCSLCNEDQDSCTLAIGVLLWLCSLCTRNQDSWAGGLELCWPRFASFFGAAPSACLAGIASESVTAKCPSFFWWGQSTLSVGSREHLCNGRSKSCRKYQSYMDWVPQTPHG